MKTRYAFADPKAPPRIGVAASNPPMTGGVVFDTFELDGTDQEALRVVEERNTPLRVERFEQGSWQPYAEEYAATDSGYDEARMFIQAIEGIGGGPVRLVSERGVPIPHKP